MSGYGVGYDDHSKAIGQALKFGLRAWLEVSVRVRPAGRVDECCRPGRRGPRQSDYDTKSSGDQPGRQMAESATSARGRRCRQAQAVRLTLATFFTWSRRSNARLSAAKSAISTVILKSMVWRPGTERESIALTLMSSFASTVVMSRSNPRGQYRQWVQSSWLAPLLLPACWCGISGWNRLGALRCSSRDHNPACRLANPRRCTFTGYGLDREA